jgi:serine/threonine protein kinase
VPRVGEVLAGKYRIVRLMAEGGMAAVYEAHHTEVGHRFAVKFLRPGLLADHQDVLERFQQEGRTAGSLESENIAGTVDCGYTTRGIAYLVMDHLAGEDLGALLAREGPLPVARAADILIQACRGIGTAHAAGIVHRDVKPENLFLCKHGDGSVLVKVLDFGIAKLTSGSRVQIRKTAAGSSMGTAYYMPPEQARGDEAIDHRADIYALGVILFQCLSGQLPHPGDSYNAILSHLLTRPPIAIETLRPELPPEIVAIVARALSSDPADRHASADALALDLAPFRGDGEAGPAQPVLEPRPAATSAGGASPASPASIGDGAPRASAARPPSSAATHRLQRFRLFLRDPRLGIISLGGIGRRFVPSRPRRRLLVGTIVAGIVAAGVMLPLQRWFRAATHNAVRIAPPPAELSVRPPSPVRVSAEDTLRSRVPDRDSPLEVEAAPDDGALEARELAPSPELTAVPAAPHVSPGK